MNRPSEWISIVSVALLASACHKPAMEEAETQASAPVVVATAKIETLQSTVAATGTVSPAPGADLTVVAPEAARIAEMPKAEGDAVRAGDLLVRFEIPTLPADVSAKEAAIGQATARVEAAKANLARLSGLVDKGVAAPREVEEARRAQADAEAELEQARSAAAAARTLAGRATVRATFPGVVAKRWHNPGDIVEAAASDPVLRIVNPAKLEVVAAVPVSDVSRIERGRAARIHVPGNDTAEQARVLMRPAQVDPSSAAANVRLSFANPTRLAVGSTVQVDIVADEHPNVLVVPAAAVVHDGDETFIMVAGPDGKAHKHPVVVGLTTPERVEIRSGVAAGDLVIVRGQDGLPDGGAITVAK